MGGSDCSVFVQCMWLRVLSQAGLWQDSLLSLLSCPSGTVLAECVEELEARRLLMHVSAALLSLGR